MFINAQELFDKTVEELEQRTKSNDQYDILMTAFLLRKLLLDGSNSLISQINKNGKQFRFSVNIREPLHKRIPSIFTENDLATYSWLAEDGFNPDSAKEIKDYCPRTLNIDEFLKKKK